MPHPVTKLLQRADMASPTDIAQLDAFESNVEWSTLIDYNATEDGNTSDFDDHPPLSSRNSLVDTEPIDHLTLEYSEQWSGAVRFRVSENGHEIDFMLHSRQIGTLIEALQRRQRGTVEQWHADRAAAKAAGDVAPSGEPCLSCGAPTYR
jgi:hypothetical protein